MINDKIRIAREELLLLASLDYDRLDQDIPRALEHRVVLIKKNLN